jgi:hypothetical protein
MDLDHFDQLARSLAWAPSRRHVLRGLASAGLGLAVVRPSPLVEAKKKRKRKKKAKKAKPNEYGCLEVNDPCRSADDCCSGICEGKKCRAHDTGICRQDKTGACTASLNELPSLTCGNECYCFRTTAGSNFCAFPPAAKGDPKCADCKKDADCLALGFPAGAACVPVGQGYCTGRCETGMACLVPCGVDLPQPAG